MKTETTKDRLAFEQLIMFRRPMPRTTDIETSDEAAPRHGVALETLVSDLCSHIREPMTMDDLVDYIASNDYSAELALQHALLLLAR